MTILKNLSDLFYPRLCLSCGKSLIEGEKFICTDCLADFPMSNNAYQSEDKLLCKFEKELNLQKIYSLFYYNKYSKYRELIRAIKYHSNGELAFYLGKMLGQYICKECYVDALVPIPLHPQKEKERGFNQSLKIAKGISEVLNIPILDKLIFRNKYTISQTGLTTEERLKNVENVFFIKNQAQAKGLHILVVDDVITTGATIHACVKLISQIENTKFSLSCLARAY